MSGHTKGLLKATRDRITGNIGQGIALVLHHGAEGDARRLAACWNALDGISTEAIEVDGPGGVARVMAENIVTMQVLRHALRVAIDSAETRQKRLLEFGSDFDRAVVADELRALRKAAEFADARMPQKNSEGEQR